MRPDVGEVVGNRGFEVAASLPQRARTRTARSVRSDCRVSSNPPYLTTRAAEKGEAGARRGGDGGRDGAPPPSPVLGSTSVGYRSVRTSASSSQVPRENPCDVARDDLVAVGVRVAACRRIDGAVTTRPDRRHPDSLRRRRAEPDAELRAGELIADRRAERHVSEPNVMFKFGESQSAQPHGDAQVLAVHGESRRQTYAAT
jgi:hypothetical protein